MEANVDMYTEYSHSVLLITIPSNNYSVVINEKHFGATQFFSPALTDHNKWMADAAYTALLCGLVGNLELRI